MEKFFDQLDRLVQHRGFALGILGVSVLLVFGNILLNSFLMDDFDFIVHWDLIQNMQNFPRFFINYIPPEAQGGVYSPLRTLAFALNYQLFGPNPIGWHVVSIVIHFCGVWAVYCLTQILVGSRWLSLLTGLLFAVHPVHVESVTAVTGSIDTIGVVLGFWALYWYLRAVLPGGEGPVFSENGQRQARSSDDVHRRFYGISLALGISAIFTHELILTLPLLIFMVDACFLTSGFSWKRALKRTAPFWGIALLYIIFKAITLGGIARGGYAFGSPYLTLLVVVKAWAKYFGILIFPAVLTHNKIISDGIMSFDPEDFDRAAFFAQSWHDPQVLASLALLLGVLAAGIACYRRRPLVAFCIGWFYATLLPVSQIVPSAVYYAERYLYPGSWTFCLLVAWIALKGYQKIGGAKALRYVYVLCICAVVAAYGLRTAVRNGDLRSWTIAFEKAVRLNPQSGYLKNDLGILYSRLGEYDLAQRYFREALDIQPDNAHFYFSAAELYAVSQQDDKAVDVLKKAIALKPEFPEAYFNLAGAMAFRGEGEKANVYLQKAVEQWKRQGKILEAGEALNAFHLFLERLKGKGAVIPAEKFLSSYDTD